MRRLCAPLCIILLISFIFIPSASAEERIPAAPAVAAPSALLMEKTTGDILYEKNADEHLFPASITKIMTMLLIVEDVEAGRLSLDDIVTTGKRPSTFGGSCVYLEEGEQMSVREMLKCIAVVSANDCAVAMAEHISGNEEQFVARMNERAAALGLKDTHFTNCTGLFDDGRHYTCARDVAIMSQELIRHEMIKEFTTIWMDSIRGGEFGLSNTNKLVYWYPGCTGLKTGYTSTAGYCLSATAERDGAEYIAVIMHASTSDARNKDAMALLDYAFDRFSLCPLRSPEALPRVRVDMGKEKYVSLVYDGAENAVIPKNSGEIRYDIKAEERVPAPVHQGDRLGTVTVKCGEKIVATLPLLSESDAERIGYFGILKRLAEGLIGL